MAGLTEAFGKPVDALQPQCASLQPELECAEQIWPDFAQQELFSPPRIPITPLDKSHFDASSSPVPPWHTFPNMKLPSDSNMQHSMQAQQELRSPAQTPRSLQQWPQTLAHSQLDRQQQLQDQICDQQLHSSLLGAQHSMLLSQESVDFSEFAQSMGLLGSPQAAR